MLDQEPRRLVTRREAITMGSAFLGGLVSACGSPKPETKPATGVATLAPVGQKPEATVSPTVTIAPKPTEVRTTPTVIPTATKEASKNPLVQLLTGTTELELPTKVTVTLGERDLILFAAGVHENLPNGFFALNDAYEQLPDGRIVGPFSRFAFSTSRLDVVSVSYDRPRNHRIKPFSVVEKIRARDGEKHDFAGKMTIAEHSGQELSFPEFAVKTESWKTTNSDNSTANGTPIHKEYDWYAMTSDTWAIVGEGEERFVERLGKARFDLTAGNTKAGPIAMWFKMYNFSTQQ